MKEILRARDGREYLLGEDQALHPFPDAAPTEDSITALLDAARQQQWQAFVFDYLKATCPGYLLYSGNDTEFIAFLHYGGLSNRQKAVYLMMH